MHAQLGYELSCGARHTYGVLGFCFRVVSSSHSAGSLQEELLLFAHTCAQTIIAQTVSSSSPASIHPTTTTTTTLSEHIQALITKKTTAHKSLKERAEGHWAEVEDRRFSLSKAYLIYLVTNNLYTFVSKFFLRPFDLRHSYIHKYTFYVRTYLCIHV